MITAGHRREGSCRQQCPGPQGQPPAELGEPPRLGSYSAMSEDGRGCSGRYDRPACASRSVNPIGQLGLSLSALATLYCPIRPGSDAQRMVGPEPELGAGLCLG